MCFNAPFCNYILVTTIPIHFCARFKRFGWIALTNSVFRWCWCKKKKKLDDLHHHHDQILWILQLLTALIIKKAALTDGRLTSSAILSNNKLYHINVWKNCIYSKTKARLFELLSHPLPKAVLLLCKAVQTSLSPLKGEGAAACLSHCDRASSYMRSSVAVPFTHPGNWLDKVE